MAETGGIISIYIIKQCLENDQELVLAMTIFIWYWSDVVVFIISPSH